MTFGDLLDQAAHDAGETDGEYRTNARRWLNLTRSYIADKTQWRWAFNAAASFDTSAATVSGFYSLSGYERISGDLLFDETNNIPIKHEAFAVLRGMDPDKSVLSSPTYWADAGTDSNGDRQIYLWPVPSATYTISYPGIRALTDVVESQLTLDIDPYFGPIMPWAHAFTAGIRYFQDLNNNEDATQIFAQLTVLEKRIDSRKRNNGVSPHAGLELQNVRSSGHVAAGRLDPSHYNNRG